MTPSAPRPAPAHVPAARPWLTLSAVCLGAMMVGLDGTAVTIAAPHIARSVDASLGDLALIANVYLVVLAICILPAGRLADRIGRRRTFIIGTLGFGLCSLGISLSPGVAELVVFRAGQGLFGALLQPAALALLSVTFARERLPAVLGVWGAVNALAIGLGPIFAGFVVQGFGWPAVFLINVPVAVLAIALVRISARESRAEPSAQPLRQVLGTRTVRVGAALVAMSSFAVFGLLFVLTLYLQNVHELTPSAAGAWLLAPTLAVVIGALAGGLLTARLGPRWPVTAGMVVVAAGLAGLATIGVDAAYWDIAAPAMLVGLGTGVWVIAATSTIVGDSGEGLVGTASAVQQAASQIGGVLGIAAIGVVMSIRVADGLGARLRDAGLPSVSSGARELVAQGLAPVPAGASAQLAEAVRGASHIAFTSGMHTAFLLSALLIALAAPLGLLLGPGAAQRARRAASAAPSPAPLTDRPQHAAAGGG